MTQTEKLSEKFSNEVGVDLNNQFENQVYGTIMGLIDSLENRLIDNETKLTMQLMYLLKHLTKW